MVMIMIKMMIILVIKFDDDLAVQDKSRSAMRSPLLPNSGYLCSLMQAQAKLLSRTQVRLDPVRTLFNPDKASVSLASLPQSPFHTPVT